MVGSNDTARRERQWTAGRVAAAVLFVLCIAASLVAGTALACEPWSKVFDSAQKGVHFAAIIASGDAQWTAGGLRIVAASGASKPEEQALGEVAMEAFGSGPDGTTYAVGSHGSIWRRDSGSSWVLEHQSRPPGTRGKGRDADMLVGVRTFTIGGRAVLAAWGPIGKPLLVRDAGGSWQEPGDPVQARDVAKLALDGPEPNLPKGCLRYQWRWMPGDGGLLMCRDRRVFAVANGAVSARGRAPSACDLMRNVTRRKDELFVGCGANGAVYQVVGEKWSAVAGVKGIYALAASENCVFGVTQRTVVRHCLPAMK
jgi:hypothetical protein